MIRGSMGSYGVSLGRTVAGFVLALLLAVLGDVLARILNLLLQYPWPLAVHQNLQVVGIGLGAGVGAYLAWMHLSLRWHWNLGALLLVLGASIGGAYLGHLFGPGPDPTYWWSRYATDKTVYPAAALGGIAVSTVVGALAGEALSRARRKPRAWPIDRGDERATGYSDAEQSE